MSMWDRLATTEQRFEELTAQMGQPDGAAAEVADLAILDGDLGFLVHAPSSRLRGGAVKLGAFGAREDISQGSALGWVAGIEVSVDDGKHVTYADEPVSIRIQARLGPRLPHIRPVV